MEFRGWATCYIGRLEIMFLKPLYILVFSRAIQVLLSIASIRLLTDLLSSEQVGELYILNSLLGWVGIVFVSGPSTYISRTILEWKEKGQGLLVLQYWIVYLCLIGVLGAVFYIIISSLPFVALAKELRVALIFMAALVSSSFLNQAASIFNILACRIRGTLFALSGTLLGIILAFSLTSYHSKSSLSWFSGVALGQGLVGLFAVVMLLKVVKNYSLQSRVLASSDLSKLWSFSWPVSLMTALFWFQSQGYRFIIEGFIDYSALGIFAVAYSVGGTIIISFEAVLQQWLIPNYYHQIATQPELNSDQIWREYVAAIVPLLFLVLCFSVLNGEYLTTILLNSEFASASKYICWGAFAEGARVINGLFYSAAIGRQKTRSMLIPQATGAIVVLTLAPLLGFLYGLHGFGSALFLSYISQSFMMWFFLDRQIFSKISLRAMLLQLPTIFVILLVALFGDLMQLSQSLIASLVLVLFSGIILALSMYFSVRDFKLALKV
jgi:O-antigen/teichoic acid export membrane protein